MVGVHRFWPDCSKSPTVSNIPTSPCINHVSFDNQLLYCFPQSVSEDARSQTDQLASEVKQLKAEMTEQNVKIERLLKQIALKQGIDVHEDTHDDSNESISHI